MQFSKQIILAAIAMIAPAVIQAAPMNSPALSIDGLNFDSFTCSISKGGVLANPNNCGQVNVETITHPGVGIEFSSGFTALGNSFDDATINYHVSSKTGISSVGLDFNGLFEGFAVSSVTETILNSMGTQVGFASVSCGADIGCTRTDSIALSGTYDNLYIQKDINVASASGGHAGISIVDQTFATAAPEPSSIALMGSGLLAAAAFLRRKAKKA